MFLKNIFQLCPFERGKVFGDQIFSNSSVHEQKRWVSAETVVARGNQHSRPHRKGVLQGACWIYACWH